MVFRSCAAALLVCVLAGCANSMQSKEKVQAAIMKRLETRTGLDLGQLDVTTTSVRFDKNLAFATVAIHPKADTDVSKGMSMKYTLEARDGQWVVLEPASSHTTARDVPRATGEPLPPGHPSIDRSGSMPNPHGPQAPGITGGSDTGSGGGADRRVQ